MEFDDIKIMKLQGQRDIIKEVFNDKSNPLHSVVNGVVEKIITDKTLDEYAVRAFLEHAKSASGSEGSVERKVVNLFAYTVLGK